VPDLCQNDEAIMSDIEERFCKVCPRKLSSLPNDICFMAVMRLKQLRSLGHEATEQEERNLSGCDWAIDHQMSGYCYFVFEAKYLQEQGINDAEIAALLNISQETVKIIGDEALNKMRNKDYVHELKTMMAGEHITQDRLEVEDETIYCE
jgi:hypothetical protein